MVNTGKPVDLTGRQFGALTVLGPSEKYYVDPKHGWRHRQWDCRCELCGRIITVRTCALRDDEKGTKSCGCQRMEHMREATTSHGDSGSRLHKIWKGMRKRCYNENSYAYDYYGGRGIRVCDEWLNDYSAFKNWALVNGYSDGLSIDRIDVNGDYCPQNCRWATALIQANNSRHCNYITYNNETHSLSEWARLLGINRLTLSNRIVSYGWTIEEAFNTPVGQYTAGQRLKEKEKKEYGTGTQG